MTHTRFTPITHRRHIVGASLSRIGRDFADALKPLVFGKEKKGRFPVISISYAPTDEVGEPKHAQESLPLIRVFTSAVAHKYLEFIHGTESAPQSPSTTQMLGHPLWVNYSGDRRRGFDAQVLSIHYDTFQTLARKGDISETLAPPFAARQLVLHEFTNNASYVNSDLEIHITDLPTPTPVPKAHAILRAFSVLDDFYSDADWSANRTHMGELCLEFLGDDIKQAIGPADLAQDLLLHSEKVLTENPSCYAVDITANTSQMQTPAFSQFLEKNAFYEIG